MRRDELECPCCGDTGAEGDTENLFYQDQPITCGCVGHVTLDDNDHGDITAYIWIDEDVPCPRCSKERE